MVRRTELVVNTPLGHAPDRTTTIFVALLDEGIEVWRPVAARPFGSGLFRIIGLVAGSERWQFPSGAIVRCEGRTFSDGSTAVMAVASGATLG